jgi:hypothetical protein
MRVETLHGDENGKDPVAFTEGGGRSSESRNVVVKFLIDLSARLVEINSSVLAVLVSAGGHPPDIFRDGSLHRPNKGMNWAKREDRRFFIPTGLAKRLPAVLGRTRFKGPRCVRAELGGNP